MAMVNVSLDTGTRQVVLTINGVLITNTDVMIEKYVWEGKDVVRCSYTVENVDSNGMKERRQFYLPSPEELVSDAIAGLDDKGLVSRVLHNDEKAKADVIDFLQQGRKS